MNNNYHVMVIFDFFRISNLKASKERVSRQAVKLLFQFIRIILGPREMSHHLSYQETFFLLSIISLGLGSGVYNKMQLIKYFSDKIVL